MCRKLAEVGVRPRRRNAAVYRGPPLRSVPAQAEAVAVRGLGAHARVQALVNDPVFGLEEQLLDQHRLTKPRHPAAHPYLSFAVSAPKKTLFEPARPATLRDERGAVMPVPSRPQPHPSCRSRL